MKIVYESATYQVKKYGAESVYMVVDKGANECLVADGRLAHTVRETIETPALTPLIDITLDGLMHLGRQYGQVEKIQ